MKSFIVACAAIAILGVGLSGCAPYPGPGYQYGYNAPPPPYAAPGYPPGYYAPSSDAGPRPSGH